MLSHITVKDFAIIDRISIDFHQGFNIITGETGAGKSIIIEAINLALGSRADTAFVRTGRDKAVIELIVNTDDPFILSLLDENGLEHEGDIFITREIHAGGKSICRINGELVSVSYLNKLCKHIADIHGQYDHQSLLNPDNHITVIDEFGASEIYPVKTVVKELYNKYSEAKNELNTLLNNKAETQRKKDFIKYELAEIQSAKLTVGEDQELNSKLMFMQNSEKIYQNLSASYELLFDSSPSCHDSLGKSSRLLREILEYSGEIGSLSESIDECYYRLEDLKSEIRRVRDSISFSAEELNETIERIDLIERLKRKYGGSIEKILEYRDKITEELFRIDNADQLIEELTNNLSLYENQLSAVCKELTALRKKAASEIENRVNDELKELNFKNAELSVAFSVLTGPDGIQYSVDGTDQIEFLIVTNKGEVPKPLSKIASGGEISRIMLALKRIIGDYDNIPTMIFDEIDSGISGITASIVGKKLKDISKAHQVICITHLAQIAAYSDHHYMISKENIGDRTITNVFPLDRQGKINEIARLLGGLNITETTLKNAEELISQSC